jgi:ureidoacrylate peracid hydrolase
MRASQASSPVTLAARPEPVTIDLAKTAVIVVDMQNAFAKKGGMLDAAGMPIDGALGAIGPCRRLLAGARASGVKVVYLKMSYNADLSNAGGPDSPNWYKETGMVLMTKNPQDWGKYVTEGTWDEEIIDELAAQPGDVVVRKQRYSGFAGTSLDHVLKTANIRYLLFAGVATNVCVWSTLADAFFLDYWPILLEDAVYSQCPPVTVEATLWNVENLFGWVSNVDQVLAVMGDGAADAAKAAEAAAATKS